jgi:hypothetical protein
MLPLLEGFEKIFQLQHIGGKIDIDWLQGLKLQLQMIGYIHIQAKHGLAFSRISCRKPVL